MPPAIEVDHVTKQFRLGQITSLSTTLKNGFNRVMGRPVVERAPFKALDDVSFKVEQGEVLGIIGHNGAGKSTMLKVLAGISQPSQGKVTVRGRVAPLIEVGAGLVPDMTGRENIFLNASILGMKRAEIKRKFDEIVAFSELEEFIDTPVKRYSSGMQVRLGFSIATSVETEILIVDEVLAVGDLAFQRKCFDRMEDLMKRQGRTVLLVSHNIRQIERICSRVILLSRGMVVIDGESSKVCNSFYEQNDERIQSHLRIQSASAAKEQSSGELHLEKVSVLDKDGAVVDRLPVGRDITVRVEVNVEQPINQVLVAVGLHTTDFVYIGTGLSDDDIPDMNLTAGRNEIVCTIRNSPLLVGVYAIRVGIAAGSAQSMIFYGENLASFQIVSPNQNRSLTSGEGFVRLDTLWEMGSKV